MLSKVVIVSFLRSLRRPVRINSSREDFKHGLLNHEIQSNVRGNLFQRAYLVETSKAPSW